ncbi:MAG: SRPBCC family protein [Solirubrobacteraceae bacterium]
MSIQTADTAVRTSIVVEAPVERAFDVFTQQMPSWWHPDHHILEGELAEMVFEPRVGGSIYDRGVDGSECRWARVLAYEPPRRVVFSWDIDLGWKIEADPDKTSEVEVRFTADGPDRTRVELEHRNLDRHGAGWERMRDAVGSSGGWGAGLQRFASAVR